MPSPHEGQTGAGVLERTPGRPALLLVISCAVALGLRLRASGDSGLWRDEALFLAVVRLPSWGEMVEFLRLSESHPPLFYGLMRVWVALAGDGDAAVALLPVLIGVALLPVVYRAGAAMYSRTAGLFAVALACLSPALAFHSGLVRPYSLLPLLTLVSVQLLWMGLNGGGRRVWAGYVVSTLALLLTHNWGMLVLAGEWVGVALCGMALRRGGRPARTALSRFALSQLAIAAGYAPWLPAFLDQAASAGHAPGPTGVGWTTLMLLEGTFSLGLQFVQVHGIWLVLLRVGLATGLLGLGYLALRRPVDPPQREVRRTALILLLAVPVATVVIAAVLSGRSNLLLVRAIVSVAPLFLLLSAIGLADFVQRARIPASICAAGVLLVFGWATLWQVPAKSNAAALARAIGPMLRPSDLIVISPEPLALSFNRYFPAPNPQVNFPVIGRAGPTRYTDLRHELADPAALVEARALLADARMRNRRVWLITDARASLDSPPAGADSLAMWTPSFLAAGSIRTRQIHEELSRLYPPTTTVVYPSTGKVMNESLRAMLFAPGGPEPRR